MNLMLGHTVRYKPGLGQLMFFFYIICFASRIIKGVNWAKPGYIAWYAPKLHFFLIFFQYKNNIYTVRYVVYINNCHYRYIHVFKHVVKYNYNETNRICAIPNTAVRNQRLILCIFNEGYIFDVPPGTL